MATVALTSENFVESVQKDGITFVDFWAAWCGPCRMFAPIFEKASEANPDVTFAKVDTDAHPDLSGGLQIQAIPTLMAFRDGYLVYREAGAMNAAGFNQLIQAVRDIDMEALKAEAEAHAKNAEADTDK